jgi:hypothetical protein
LRAKGGAAFFIVEIAEKWVVFAVEDATRVKLLCENFCESRLAHAYGPFDYDVPRRLEVWFGHIHAAGL